MERLGVGYLRNDVESSLSVQSLCQDFLVRQSSGEDDWVCKPCALAEFREYLRSSALWLIACCVQYALRSRVRSAGRFG